MGNGMAGGGDREVGWGKEGRMGEIGNRGREDRVMVVVA